jgi:hypothetical protein
MINIEHFTEKAREALRVQRERSPKTPTSVQQTLFYPPWPTSRPGPLVIAPGEGQRPINPMRSEQIVEGEYHQK